MHSLHSINHSDTVGYQRFVLAKRSNSVVIAAISLVITAIPLVTAAISLVTTP